jgi:TonB family protein
VSKQHVAMNSLVLAAIAGLLLPSTALAALPVPSPIPPAGKWAVDYGENACTLSRQFGYPARPVTLGIIPQPMSKYARVVVVSPDRLAAIPYAEGSIGFDGLPTPIKTRFEVAPDAKVGSIMVGHVEGELLGGIEKSTVLTFRPQGTPVALRIGPSARAVAALRLCVADLLARWGMDKAAQAQVVTPPDGSVVGVFRAEDYPSDALRANQQGEVTMRFWVETNGRISDCKVAKSSGSTSLDTNSCGILTERLKLLPARDAKGAPVRSLTTTTVTWSIPG